MGGSARSLAVDALILAGLAVFFIFLGPGPLRLVPALLALALILPRLLRRPGVLCRRCLLPFAAGLLALLMRRFYWDGIDFSLRLRSLLLLAAVFSLAILARERRWPQRSLRRFNSLALKKRLLAIFIVAELLFVLAAAMLTRRGVALVGDEPHYLAISQSLARDGDLNVFNQYFREGFKEFLNVERLAAHGTWGKGYKRIYSYHLPGLSLTVAPFFFLKLSPPLLYFLLRAWLGLFGALLAVLVYLFGLRLGLGRSHALFATLAFTLTAPVFFFSVHIFPEVQAMLLLLGALYLLFFKAEGKGLHALWAGLLLGSTIFWGVKYALFIYPITLGFCAYWLWHKRYRQALLLLVFPLLFQALFFYYLYAAYGSFSPNAVYYGMLNPEQSQAFYDTLLRKIPLQARWETLLDYFFDQRDGLLLYNPFYFLAFPGWLLALRNFKRYRLHLLVSLPAWLFVLNHAFSTIRAGYCPQGRYLAPITWALLLFALVYYRESRNRFFRRAFLVLPLYALFVTAYQVAQPLTLYQPTTHDSLVRQGLLFQQWSSSRINLPDALPSFIKIDNQGYWPNIIFLAIFLLLLFLALVPWRGKRRAGLPWLLFLCLFSLCCLFPRPDLTDPQRIPGPRGLPCQVHIQPQPEADTAGAAWDFKGPHRSRMLIETLVPLKEIEMTVQNRSATLALDLNAVLFDSPAARRRLPAGGRDHLRWLQPAYRRIRARYYYQFTLRGTAAAASAWPGWSLRLGLR